MIYQLLGHFLKSDESAISIMAWIKKLRTLPLWKVQKKSTEKLRFLQVAKGRVVQKYISILEENTAWMRYQRVSKYLLHLIWVHKNSIMNIQSWCSISSIFFPAPFPNAFIPVCDIKLLIWLLSKAQHNMQNNLIISQPHCWFRFGLIANCGALKWSSSAADKE